MKTPDLSLLNITAEQKEQVGGLIMGKINPEFYQSVNELIRECHSKPAKHELIMCALNEILEGYGVESIEGDWQNRYWCNILATYVNMGDTYEPTVIYHRDKGILIMSWGDFVEKHKLY